MDAGGTLSVAPFICQPPTRCCCEHWLVITHHFPFFWNVALGWRGAVCPREVMHPTPVSGTVVQKASPLPPVGFAVGSVFRWNDILLTCSTVLCCLLLSLRAFLGSASRDPNLRIEEGKYSNRYVNLRWLCSSMVSWLHSFLHLLSVHISLSAFL